MSDRDYFGVDLSTGSSSNNPWNDKDLEKFMEWEKWTSGRTWMIVNRKT